MGLGLALVTSGAAGRLFPAANSGPFFGMVGTCTARHGMARYGTVRYGMAGLCIYVYWTVCGSKKEKGL